MLSTRFSLLVTRSSNTRVRVTSTLWLSCWFPLNNAITWWVMLRSYSLWLRYNSLVYMQHTPVYLLIGLIMARKDPSQTIIKARYTGQWTNKGGWSTADDTASARDKETAKVRHLYLTWCADQSIISVAHLRTWVRPIAETFLRSLPI